MKKVKKSNSKSKSRAQSGSKDTDPVYFIDKNDLKERGTSYQFMIYSRLCRRGSCQLCQNHGKNEFVAPLPNATNLVRYVKSHCFKQDDYPNHKAALLEIVFLLLVRNEGSMTLSEIEQSVAEVWKDIIYIKNRTRQNIVKTLEGPNQYGIKLQSDKA